MSFLAALAPEIAEGLSAVSGTTISPNFVKDADSIVHGVLHVGRSIWDGLKGLFSNDDKDPITPQQANQLDTSLTTLNQLFATCGVEGIPHPSSSMTQGEYRALVIKIGHALAETEHNVLSPEVHAEPNAKYADKNGVVKRVNPNLLKDLIGDPASIISPATAYQMRAFANDINDVLFSSTMPNLVRATVEHKMFPAASVPTAAQGQSNSMVCTGRVVAPGHEGINPIGAAVIRPNVGTFGTGNGMGQVSWPVVLGGPTHQQAALASNSTPITDAISEQQFGVYTNAVATLPNGESETGPARFMVGADGYFNASGNFPYPAFSTSQFAGLINDCQGSVDADGVRVTKHDGTVAYHPFETFATITRQVGPGAAFDVPVPRVKGRFYFQAPFALQFDLSHGNDNFPGSANFGGSRRSASASLKDLNATLLHVTASRDDLRSFTVRGSSAVTLVPSQRTVTAMNTFRLAGGNGIETADIEYTAYTVDGSAEAVPVHETTVFGTDLSLVHALLLLIDPMSQIISAGDNQALRVEIPFSAVDDDGDAIADTTRQPADTYYQFQGMKYINYAFQNLLVETFGCTSGGLRWTFQPAHCTEELRGFCLPYLGNNEYNWDVGYVPDLVVQTGTLESKLEVIEGVTAISTSMSNARPISFFAEPVLATDSLRTIGVTQPIGQIMSYSGQQIAPGTSTTFGSRNVLQPSNSVSNMIGKLCIRYQRAWEQALRECPTVAEYGQYVFSLFCGPRSQDDAARSMLLDPSARLGKIIQLVNYFGSLPVRGHALIPRGLRTGRGYPTTSARS